MGVLSPESRRTRSKPSRSPNRGWAQGSWRRMSWWTSGRLGCGNWGALRASVAASTWLRAPLAGVGPPLFDGLCGLGSWLSSVGPWPGATQRWAKRQELRQPARLWFARVASFGACFSGSATS